MAMVLRACIDNPTDKDYIKIPTYELALKQWKMKRKTICLILLVILRETAQKGPAEANKWVGFT